MSLLIRASYNVANAARMYEDVGNVHRRVEFWGLEAYMAT